MTSPGGAPPCWQRREPSAQSPKFERLDLRTPPSSPGAEAVWRPRRGAGAPLRPQSPPRPAPGSSRSRVAPAAAGKALLARAQRAKRRAPSFIEVSSSHGLTVAEQRSISAPTRAVYRKAYEAFLGWIKIKQRIRASLSALDTTLTDYLNSQLYRRGENVAAARNVVFGTMFFEKLPKSALTLPRARRALNGFVKDEPLRSSDPLPVEAMALLAEALLTEDDRTSTLAAAALVISFDLFLRPSEALALTAADVVAPRVGQYGHVSVMVAQLDPSLRRNEEAPRPAKSGEFDDTILAGLPGLNLMFVAPLLLRLRQGAQRGLPMLAPLTLAQYETSLHRAARATDLAALRPMPHSARHGGASLAAVKKCLSLRGIQRRGRWLAASSVRRYEKHSKLTRQVARMPRASVRRGEALLEGGRAAPLAQRLLAALAAPFDGVAQRRKRTTRKAELP